MTDTEDLIYRLRKRAEIRRQIPTRKSVQEGKPMSGGAMIISLYPLATSQGIVMSIRL